MQNSESSTNWKIKPFFLSINVEFIVFKFLFSYLQETAFETLQAEIEKTLAAKPENLLGFLIEGFPRTMEQMDLFEKGVRIL